MIDDSADERRLRAEAVDWVQLLDSGQATAADIEALKAWRSRSAAHEASFAEADQLWRNFAAAARRMRERGELASPSLPKVASRPILSRRAALGGGIALAASVAGLCAGADPPLGLWPSFAELAADYRTTTGEQRRLTLAGDVTMHLNTQTSVALRPPDGSVDRVELVAGEATFSAGERTGRSLVVLAAEGAASTTNGRFDIRRIGTSVCVTCIDGDVRVASSTDAAALGRSQQVRYDERGLGRVVPTDLELVTAWQEGVLIFRMMPLADVVNEINRYRAGRVVLIDRRLADLPVSGRFRIDHIDEIIARLGQAFGVTSKSLPGGIVLLG
ncbi:FecR family protein [Bradyrhizobium sp. STM 3562]|uniref:FecR family protein n=1 Tax=Bradyrhizobium sp. STM 3562 TaxID=578924 RepID=UPI00388E9CC6